MRHNPRPETLAQPTAKRARRPHRATGRPKSETSPEIAAIEAEFSRLVALTGCADFDLACAVEEASVIAGLRHAVLTHHVGCTTIRGWAALLVRIQDAQVAHAEHIVNDLLPECRCNIATLEEAREAA